MDLAGQCWKPSVKASWERLAPVLERMRQAEPVVRPAPQPRQIRRPGQVMRLLEAILAESEWPLRAVELHQAIEKRLGESVSRSSVDSALWHAVRRDDVAIARIGYGRYEASA